VTRLVEFTDPHQRRHFEFFRAMNHPHWSITADVEIGPWLSMARGRDLKVTPAVVHLLARAANHVPQLRRRIRESQVVEHDVVHPTFSVATDVTDAFSFCHVDYGEDLDDFVGRATNRMEEMRSRPVFEDEEGRDDYLFMSPLPWISFTAIQHAMHYHPHDSVPRISWGRFYEADARTMMPLSLQSHHALVDGVHAGRFFQRVEALVAEGVA
jgi:chloramphenicol O-acetyltransferase type A